MNRPSMAGEAFRLVVASVGWCAVGLGAVGLVVPGLPTTVFVLIGFYCFSKSSPRFAQWLRQHRWLGRSLARHLAGNGMSREAKRAALTGMWTSILVSSALLLQVRPLAALCTICLGLVGTLSIQFGVRTMPAHTARALT
jgi:uncharacterized membrane protein YbaN (DUF454 family)